MSSLWPALIHLLSWGMRVKLLSKTYSTIVKQFHLADRAGFKEKFGAEGDPQYVCVSSAFCNLQIAHVRLSQFPKHSLGLKGVEAIMSVLQANKPDE